MKVTNRIASSALSMIRVIQAKIKILSRRRTKIESECDVFEHFAALVTAILRFGKHYSLSNADLTFFVSPPTTKS
jgi:hypothetical protein